MKQLSFPRVLYSFFIAVPMMAADGQAQSQTTITNFDYTNARWQRGVIEMGPENDTRAIQLVFDTVKPRNGSLRIRSQGKVLDLAAPGFSPSHSFPMRTQIQIYEFETDKAAKSFVVSIPFEAQDGKCLSINFDVQNLLVVDTKVSSTSPERCEW